MQKKQDLQAVKPIQIKQEIDPTKFGDDEPLPKNMNDINPDALKNYLQSANFKLQIKPHQKTVKLKNNFTMPVLVSISSQDYFQIANEEKLHINLDIVCVIDHSGSMDGIKIKQVRETLKYLLDQLRENDRFSLVIFDDKAKRLTPLIRMTPQNKFITQKQIDQIQPDGGTDINQGLQFGLEILSRRRCKNIISSIFLLSDGIDEGAFQQIQQSVQKINVQPSDFTIHTFGYGNDHDPQQLIDISKLKGGEFYYINKLDQVDLCFVDCLGGLLSTIGSNVQIKVELNFNNNLVQNSFIEQGYGKVQINANRKQCSINVGQILAGTSKDFVFLLSLPAVNKILQDEEKNVLVASATCSMNQIKNQDIEKEENQIVLKDEMYLTILNPAEELKDFEIDEAVEFHYLRELAANQLELVQNAANQNQYQVGEKIIDDTLKRIGVSKQKQAQQIQLLADDLRAARAQMNQQSYQNQGGKQYIAQIQKVHQDQQSQPLYSNAQQLYSNSRQVEMVSKRKTQK